jgi:hypothetical protein
MPIMVFASSAAKFADLAPYFPPTGGKTAVDVKP